jgi:RNA 2',3'-cyclic 3'-phosphodiesterase
MGPGDPMRAFIAIDLAPEIKDGLRELVRTLKATRADVRWVEPDGMHLTLKFLGEIDAARADRVREVLAATALRHPAFPVRLEGTGAFPGDRAPRVFWAGVAAGPELAAFHMDLEAALAVEGFETEARDFRPHLTLGRVKGPGRLGEAAAELDRRRTGSFGAMTVRRIALFESRLGPGGASYRIVDEAELA